MPSRDKDSYNIRSVENALLLLEALANEDDQPSLAQLSQRLDMTKASLFRLMATFENHRFVERDPVTGEYRLGMAAFEVSQKLLAKMTLLNKARPIMMQLARQCNETVYLVIRREHDALFLEMADNDQKVKVVPLTGQRFPLTDCASGRVLLAFATPPVETPLDGQLDAILERCREERYCFDRNGVGEGSSCLAVPVFAENAVLAGCLAMVGPSFRMDAHRVDMELIPALKSAGDVVSARLGHNAFST